MKIIKETELKQANFFILHNHIVDVVSKEVTQAGLKKEAKTQLRLNKNIGVDLEVTQKDLNLLINAYSYLLNDNFRIEII